MSRYFIQLKGETVEQTIQAYGGFWNGDDSVRQARDTDSLCPSDLPLLWRVVRVKELNDGKYKILSVHKVKVDKK